MNFETQDMLVFAVGLKFALPRGEERKHKMEHEMEHKVEKDPNGMDQHESGAKLDQGKLRPDLVLGGFNRALSAVVAVGTFGANKYTENGWLSVPNGIARYSDAAGRHQFAVQKGGVLSINPKRS